MEPKRKYTKTDIINNLFVVSKATEEDLKGKTDNYVLDKLYKVVSSLKKGEKVSMPISLRGTAARVKKHQDFTEFKLTTRVSADKKCIAIIRIA